MFLGNGDPISRGPPSLVVREVRLQSHETVAENLETKHKERTNQLEGVINHAKLSSKTWNKFDLANLVFVVVLFLAHSDLLSEDFWKEAHLELVVVHVFFISPMIGTSEDTKLIAESSIRSIYEFFTNQEYRIFSKRIVLKCVNCIVALQSVGLHYGLFCSSFGMVSYIPFIEITNYWHEFDFRTILHSLAVWFLMVLALSVVRHRYCSHEVFKTSRIFNFILCAWSCITLQRGPIWWASMHKRHHTYSNTRFDPHSPAHHQWWMAHSFWMFSVNSIFIDWSTIPEHLTRPEILALECLSIRVGYLILTKILYVGPNVFWLSFALFNNTIFAVNSLSHKWGEVESHGAFDHKYIAILAGGEYHGNHHDNPRSARTGKGWDWEPNYWVICIMEKLSLVWDVQHGIS